VAHPAISAFSQFTVVVPTVEVIWMAVAAAKPCPVMVRLEPTVPDVADSVSVGVAACAGVSGTSSTNPNSPDTINSVDSGIEASFVFVYSFCIFMHHLFFRKCSSQIFIYKTCGQFVYIFGFLYA
jgi:hypothetical protein